MKLKLVIVAAALIAMSAFAQAQQGGAPPKVPKPTKADVQKVVQMIMADKAKVQAYCQLSKLNDQMAAAQEKKDQKKMDALANQADALVQKIGPEYEKLMEGLDQVDENSPDAKTFGDMFAPLDKQCGA
ncbi:MAG: hypothetical protein WAV27_11805 [Xanthobacteraceae bacterium]|jgi:parvulin-like peptidyl-prolyl isomerase